MNSLPKQGGLVSWSPSPPNTLKIHDWSLINKFHSLFLVKKNKNSLSFYLVGEGETVLKFTIFHKNNNYFHRFFLIESMKKEKQLCFHMKNLGFFHYLSKNLFFIIHFPSELIQKMSEKPMFYSTNFICY